MRSTDAGSIDVDRGGAEQRAIAAPNQSLAHALLQRWGWVLITFVVSRLLIAALTRLSRMIFVHGEFWQRNGITGMLTQGDGERYLQVAAAGYGSGAEGAALAGFFPFYPLLIRIFSVIFEPAMAAMVVSNIALLAAGILLKELVQLHYRESRIGNIAVTFLMFSPLSFFFSGAYPEATFVALSLGAFLAAAHGRWLVASLCGMCVALTNGVGFLIVVPLAIEYFRNTETDRRTAPPVRLALLALIPLACGAFMWFSYSQFGDALAPFRAAAVWEGGLVPPWVTVGTAELLPKFYRHFTLLMLCFGLGVFAAALFLKVRLSHVVFAALLLAAYVGSASIASIARELNIVFPLFITLALLSRRFDWLYEPLLVISFTIFSFCTVMSANGHWMR